MTWAAGILNNNIESIGETHAFLTQETSPILVTCALKNNLLRKNFCQAVLNSDGKKKEKKENRRTVVAELFAEVTFKWKRNLFRAYCTSN